MIEKITDSDMRNFASFKGEGSIAKNVKRSNTNYDFNKENQDLIHICEQDWNNLRLLRTLRRRNVRYSNGDQWSDVVVDENGKPIREDVKMSREGKTPLKHNFIQQCVRNIQGQMLQNRTQATVVARTEDDSELGEMLTNTLQACLDNNREDALNIAAMNDILYGGITAAKIRYDFIAEKDMSDGILDVVPLERLFFNTEQEDPRMDIRRIGEIHDYTWDEMLFNFCKSSEDEKILRTLYPDYGSEYETLETANKVDAEEQISFTLCRSPYKCRVIEVWQRKGRWVRYVHDYADGSETVTDASIKELEELNDNRKLQGQTLGIPVENIPLLYYTNRFEFFWEVRYITPNGVCILQKETPYAHQSHPYVISTMPMVDGTIRAALTDLVDIQRYINRLIVMLDFIMGNSAKGVLLVPEDCIPEGMSVDDFAKEYVKANGVILYTPNKTNPNSIPTQLSSNSTNIGAFQMLELEMSLFQQISGLNGAIQGHEAKSGTPSSLYAQEAQNAATNFRIIFDIFASYQKQRDTKLLKVLMQYYSEKRFVDINGSAYDDIAKYYTPELANKVVDFNLVIASATNTPVYRQIADDTLQQLMSAGAIDLKTYLRNCSMPFAKKLLADITQSENQAQQQMGPEQYSNMIGQYQQQAGVPDATASRYLQQMVG